MNAFSFASVVNLATGSGKAAPAAGLTTGAARTADVATVTRVQSLTVPAGAPFLVVSVSDPAQIQFPAGVQISIKDPGGRTFTQNQDTPDLMRAAPGHFGLAHGRAQPGAWFLERHHHRARHLRFSLLVPHVPSTNVVGTLMADLGPIYGYNASPHARMAALSAEGSWAGWAGIIGGIGLGGIAAIAAVVPGGQGLAVWAGVGAALAISAGVAKLWGESAGAAKLTPDQAASQAASTGGFTPDGKSLTPSLAEVWEKVRGQGGRSRNNQSRQLRLARRHGHRQRLLPPARHRR